MSKGVAVGAAMIGGLLAWGGLNNAGILSTARDVIAGQRPEPGSQQSFGFSIAGVNIGGSASGNGATVGGIGGNSVIAQDALQYKDKGRYVWGGGQLLRWDCSGFCNYVIGKDLSLAIPGHAAGTWAGTSHGPATPQWAIWPGCQTISAAEAGPGDIVVWPAFHMGIVTGPDTFINCPGPQGSPAPIVSSISKVTLAGPRLFRRLK